MIYFGVALLWLIAGLSLVSVSAATPRRQRSVAWLSGFITAIAVMDTAIVFVS